VGVDVVEATLMVVEHAERFGLAALHQLRGRVGRGGRKSHCYLITPERRALQRLRIMERSQDGFLIAQADLEHRCVDTQTYDEYICLQACSSTPHLQVATSRFLLCGFLMERSV